MAVVAAISLCTGAVARADLIHLEAEDYKVGGEGIGYHDDAGKDGDGRYRAPDTVGVEMGSEGYNVGWTNGGEWIVLTTDTGVWLHAWACMPAERMPRACHPSIGGC